MRPKPYSFNREPRTPPRIVNLKVDLTYGAMGGCRRAGDWENGCAGVGSGRAVAEAD